VTADLKELALPWAEAEKITRYRKIEEEN